MRRSLTSFCPIKPGDSLGPYSAGSRVDNTGSIEASLGNEDDYTVEPGLQSVPLGMFYEGKRPNLVTGRADELRRTRELAEQIRESERMDPVIVVIDKEGPYVLEGAHRLDAAYLLNGTHIPAMVVREAGIKPLTKRRGQCKTR